MAHEQVERRRVVFEGRVQGVGFRATARAVARGFEVSGWVRNEADGTVLLEVQGAGAAVEGFLGALGERMGRLITRATPVSVAVEVGEERFEIRR